MENKILNFVKVLENFNEWLHFLKYLQVKVIILITTNTVSLKKKTLNLGLRNNKFKIN